MEPRQQLIVTTEETRHAIDAIQDRRKGLGMNQMDVHIVKLICSDNEKISSTMIRKALIGRYLRGPNTQTKYTNTYVIGLTGPTCSGKSSVCRAIERMGNIEIISCDLEAHETYLPGSLVYHQIIETFGASVLEGITSDHVKIDRKLLGSIVFGNPSKLETLNKLVWPALKQRIEARIRLSDKEVVVLDAAVLIQAGFTTLVDEVWVCAMDTNTRIERLIRSRGLTHEQAVERSNTQLADEEYVRHADVILSTKQDQSETQHLVEDVWANLLKRIRSLGLETDG